LSGVVLVVAVVVVVVTAAVRWRKSILALFPAVD
jgi:hypothetical protein